MITGAQAVVNCLVKQGVSAVFGYPGATICPFYDCLSGSDIRHILVRQEQNAGHAANGYARITGKPGVCVATSGPGATNLITALATAYMDSIPLVAITGQVSSELLGRDVFQEADITGAAEPFTKHSYLVKDPAEIPRVMEEAFYIAGTGRPGPVLIDLPIDVQKKAFTPAPLGKVAIRGYRPTEKGHPGQIRRVAEAVAEAKRPLLCIGGGVFASHAQEQVRLFSEQAGIPVVATLMGIGVMPTRHSNYFGMLGTHGKPYANRAVGAADLLIIIGARVGDRAVTAPAKVEKTTRIVHIDIDPAEIGKNVGTGIPLVGDAATVLTQLLEYAPKADSAQWLEQITEWKNQYSFDFAPRQEGVNPKAFVRMLAESMQDDSVYVADVGQNQMWSANNLLMRPGGRFLTTGGMGTMGYSIPAALGAKLADPSRQVVTVCGDGAFQMSMNELATAVQNEIPLKLVVMKNCRLGMVREIQTNAYKGNCTAVGLCEAPDICALAAAYGIPAQRVETLDAARDAIQQMLDAPGSYLIECRVSDGETTL